jgi:hypothetical protein
MSLRLAKASCISRSIRRWRRTCPGLVLTLKAALGICTGTIRRALLSLRPLDLGRYCEMKPSASPEGVKSPVSPPEIVCIGATFPLLPAEYTVTEPASPPPVLAEFTT